MKLSEWLSSISSNEWTIFIKRLSANDTGATKSHQSGVYIPEKVIQSIFPRLNSTETLNPDHRFLSKIESHECNEQELRAIYYNNRFFTGTRNEKRITCWSKGTNTSPIQDPESTGSLAIFAFHRPSDNNSDYLRVWVCRDIEEEDEIENHIGEVIPGTWKLDSGVNLFSDYKILLSDDYSQGIPDEWRSRFPSGEEISNYIIINYPLPGLSPDKIILEWRKKEFELFSKIEDIHVKDKISTVMQGGESVFSTTEFVSLANSILNRRKSRSGRSLELLLEKIFPRFGLTQFSTQSITENSKRPDFVFPSIEKYHDINYPTNRLRMLAVKTTCKDRWRQILNEADRLKGNVHLFTLQEGVSTNQFMEMRENGVTLVVPQKLHTRYPEKVRHELLSLDSFIKSTKNIIS